MATRTSWIHSPQQVRSKDTTDRILRAVGQLMERKDLDDLSVAEIARAAKVSVGGFYARFPSKQAVLHAFDEFIVERAMTAVRRALDPETLAGESVEGVVSAYIRMAVRFFARHRGIARQVYLKARTTGDASYVARMQRFNEFAHGRLREALLERQAEIGHPDPEAACAFGVMMVSAAMREAIFFGERKINLSNAAGRELVDELTRAFCGYLGVAPSR